MKKIMGADITALENVLVLITEFFDKNPLRKDESNFIRIERKLKQLKELEKDDEASKVDLFNSILKSIRSMMKREIYPKIFLLVGGHGGIIIDDIGYCEFDSPKFVLNRLIERMQFAIETGMPYNIELAISCLEWLNNKFPKEISEFLRLYNLGRFEIINPTYSQPYNLIIGPESNIKQFEYGLKVLNQLGIKCKIYHSSECSLHPQIPQLLNGFDIDFGSLRTRLLGMCPTTHSGSINWIGLDDTAVKAITDLTGIFNGEYWHGMFFKELPDLLFQAVARPFTKHIIYSSIEDMVMPLPYQEDVWRVSQFSEIFGQFVLCSELFQLIETDGEFKYSRDNFFLGDYIFVPSDLLLNNKICEAKVISAEILNCLLGFFSEESEDSLVEKLWSNLLLTQAHDNYAVPFIRPGDYSKQQLSTEDYKQLECQTEKIPISELSIQIQKEIQSSCDDFMSKGLEKLTNHLGTDSNTKNGSADILVFNPTTMLRRDVFAIPVNLENPVKLRLKNGSELLDFQYKNSVVKFLPEIPPIGYKIYSFVKQDENTPKRESYFYTISILEDRKSIQIKFKEDEVYRLSFKSEYDYQLSIEEHNKDSIEEKYSINGKIGEGKFRLEIIQYNEVNRLEFILHSHLLREIIVVPSIPVSRSLINYPFGVEETRRSKIQTLDFLLLQGADKGIIFLIKNSQRFLIDRKTLTIHNVINPRGRFEFAIAITTESALHSAFAHVSSFQFNLVGINVKPNYEFSKKADSFLSFESPLILINLWRRSEQSFLRVLNASPREQTIDFKGLIMKNQLKEINLHSNELRILKNAHSEIGPWKILTIKL